MKKFGEMGNQMSWNPNALEVGGNGYNPFVGFEC